MLHAADELNHLQNWGTPRELFDPLDAKWGFTLDVCAQQWNAKCSRFYTKKDDGLLMPWGPRENVWCNPPYDNPTPWLERGWLAALELNSTATYLLPNATETRWFQNLAFRGDIYFIRGRLKHEPPPGYEGENPGPPFGSVIVRFYPEIAMGDQVPECFLLDRDGEVSSARRMVQSHLW